MHVPIFKQIAPLLACVERCKVGDFVCKKAGIEWERESSGEVRYLHPLPRGWRAGSLEVAALETIFREIT
jgi:hypothetical protein